MSSVIEARAALERATEQEATERREKLIAQLCTVTAQLKEARATHQKIAFCIKREREERHKLRFQIEHVEGLLANSSRCKPSTADYVPNEENVQWVMDHAMMERAKATLLEQLSNVPDSLTIDAMKYEGPTGLLAQLEYSERNLLNALDPAGRDAWLKGGVFAVSDM